MKCKVKFCRNESRCKIRNLSFFRFPRNNLECDTWRKFCDLPADFYPTGQHRICSLHFREDDIYMDPNGKLRRQQKSFPVFKTVAQVADTSRRRKIPDEFDSDLENAPPFKRTSFRAEHVSEYLEYEFLDEALDNPEGLALGCSGATSAQKQIHSVLSQCQSRKASTSLSRTV